MRIAATTVLTAFATTFPVVAAPPAFAATFTSAGPLTDVRITPDLHCDVRHALDPAPEFYQETACGTLVTVNGTLYGPAGR